MKLSQSGPIGNYTVMFTCSNGFYSLNYRAVHDIEVKTSINKSKIKFTQQIPSEVLVKDFTQTEYDFVAIIEVLDSSEKGVVGKYPEKIYFQPNGTDDPDCIEGQIMHESDLFTASKKDGVMTIPIKVTKLKEDALSTVTFTIDNINITTKYVKFIKSSDLKLTSIATIKMTDTPQKEGKISVQIGETFDIKVKVYDFNGDEVDGERLNLGLEVFFELATEAPFRPEFVLLKSDEPSIRRNEVTFENVNFPRAATGDYHIRVYYIDTNNEFIPMIIGELIPVHVDSKVDYNFITKIYQTDNNDHNFDVSKLKEIPLKRSNPEDVHDEYIPVRLGQTYVFELYVGNFKNMLKDVEVPAPTLEFEEFPPMMQSFEGNATKYFRLTGHSSKTNDTGFYFVEVKFEYGGIGGYVIFFNFGTSISVPQPFITNNPISKIKIETSPDFSKTPFDDPVLEARYCGRPFDHKARIRIIVDEGPKSDYIVVAHPVSVNGEEITVEMLPESGYDLDEKKENYPAWISMIEGIKAVKTDYYGEAIFDQLSVWDITGTNATTKFVFAVGDRHPGLYLRTNVTEEEHTFIPSLSFSVVDEPKKYVTTNGAFGPAIKATSLVDRYFILVSVQLNEIFGKEVKDNYFSTITNRYMTGIYCLGFTDQKEFYSGG